MKHVATLMLALLLSKPASGQQPVPAEQLKQAIATCIAVVRGLPDEYRNQYRTFDAYVTAKGTVDRWPPQKVIFSFTNAWPPRG